MREDSCTSYYNSRIYRSTVIPPVKKTLQRNRYFMLGEDAQYFLEEIHLERSRRWTLKMYIKSVGIKYVHNGRMFPLKFCRKSTRCNQPVWGDDIYGKFYLCLNQELIWFVDKRKFFIKYTFWNFNAHHKHVKNRWEQNRYLRTCLLYSCSALRMPY